MMPVSEEVLWVRIPHKLGEAIRKGMKVHGWNKSHEVRTALEKAYGVYEDPIFPGIPSQDKRGRPDN